MKKFGWLIVTCGVLALLLPLPRLHAAIVKEPELDPPHQRVKPEYRFDKHVNRSCEVVASTDMAQLVSKDGLQLFR